MDPAHFIKLVINSGTTSHFLRDIWRPTEYRSQIAVVYSEYSCTNKKQVCNFVNDFIYHRSYLSSQLSSDQIQCIHEENVKHATLTEACVNKSQHSPAAGGNQHSSSYWTPDVLITDSLLDKFHIIPGYRDKRLKDFYMQSRILYYYLTYQLGNEHIVKARRKILRKKFSTMFCSHSNKIKSIVRGSRSEGLSMQGSDTDILVECISAYENGEGSKDGLYLRYDSVSGSLGYVTVKYVWGVTFSSDMYKKMCSGILSLARYIMSTVIHGPSISLSTCGDDFDIVPCIKSVDWPNIAQEWVYRKRRYGWPSQEMINYVVRQGCHIVPIGNEKLHIDEVEWRLSFSTAEEELVWSFKHTQLLIYGFFKIILKEILNQNANTSEILCSYFLKTVMFWMIEETHVGIWSPQNTILCFNLCLERLIQFIIDENCPNYFVPVNNMFEKRFTPDSKKNILQVLCDISANGITWKSSSMFGLEGYLKDPYRVYDLKMECSKKYAKEIYEMALDLARVGKHLPFTLTLQAFPKESVISYLKSFCSNSIIHDNVANQICHFLDISKCKTRNKKTYVFHNICLRLLLKGCKEDLMSGRAILGTWLYKQGKYGDCIQVIDHALERLKFRILHVGLKSVQYVRPNNNIVDFDKISFLNVFHKLKNFTTYFVPMPANSVIMPDEMAWFLSIIQPFIIETSLINPVVLSFPPEMYCYFLKCLSYLRQRKMVQFREEFVKMEQVKNIGSLDENVMDSIASSLLRIILEITRKKGANNFNCDITPFDMDSEYLSLVSPELITYYTSIINVFSHNRERMGISMETVLKHIDTIVSYYLPSLE